MVLFQILSRTLQQQRPNGSWGLSGSREETSYAIIALTYVASLPLAAALENQIQIAIQRGRDYLLSDNSVANMTLTKRDCIWISKISYASEYVCHSYVLAALNSPTPHCSLGLRVEQLANVPFQKVDPFTKFYANLSCFKAVDEWLIKAWLIEGYLFLVELERRCLDGFGRKSIELEKYFEYIPFSWTSSNGLAGISMGAQSLLDMMTFTMFIFHVDEFFERDLTKEDAFSSLKQLPRSIETVFSRVNSRHDILEGIQMLSHDDQLIYRQLAKFAQYILSFPKIQNASKNDQAQLKFELEAYILANAQQLEDHFRLRNQESRKVHASPPSPFIKWVHNTGTEHFGGFCAFALIVCLLGNGDDFLPNSEVKYIAQDCSRRISVALRMLNDSGSLSRDRSEVNLNSLFFPEFIGERKGDSELRAELVDLAKYERRCFTTSLKELKRVCGDRFPQVYKAVRVYYYLCEYYTALYAARQDLL